MKKVLLALTLVLFCFPLAFATIITNTNQSTQYLRLFARNASTDTDAVYYNPAGLTKLSEDYLEDLSYELDSHAFGFGSFTETYKKTSWAFSVGLGYGF